MTAPNDDDARTAAAIVEAFLAERGTPSFGERDTLYSYHARRDQLDAWLRPTYSDETRNRRQAQFQLRPGVALRDALTRAARLGLLVEEEQLPRWSERSRRRLIWTTPAMRALIDQEANRSDAELAEHAAGVITQRYVERREERSHREEPRHWPVDYTTGSGRGLRDAIESGLLVEVDMEAVPNRWVSGKGLVPAEHLDEWRDAWESYVARERKLNDRLDRARARLLELAGEAQRSDARKVTLTLDQAERLLARIDNPQEGT